MLGNDYAKLEKSVRRGGKAMAAMSLPLIMSRFLYDCARRIENRPIEALPTASGKKRVSLHVQLIFILVQNLKKKIKVMPIV